MLNNQGFARTSIGAPAARFMLALLVFTSWDAVAQARQEAGGVTLYWGLVPAAVVAQRPALEELHAGPPRGGGQVHHLVVALFDTASGRRIDNAVVRAQLHEVGIVDEAPKYLIPMTINAQATYGQVFGVANEGPYRFRVFVRLPDRATEIEFGIRASSPHAPVH